MGKSPALLLLAPLVVVTFFSANDGSTAVRRLATDCINTVYNTPQNAVNMPDIPSSGTDNVPAYLSLCQEWIRMDANNGSNTEIQTLAIEEDERVCLDWSAPHLALMDIFSAMIVSSHLPRVTYSHNCGRTKTREEAAFGFDATTIQQTLIIPKIRPNYDVLSAEAIKQQCRRCLLTYDSAQAALRTRSKGFHHCFAFPVDSKKALVLDPGNIPYVPYNFPGVVPFSSVVIPFRQRLYQSALAWQAVTDKPPQEEESGVVYWLDPSTPGLAYSDVLAQIPDLNITSFSILASPLCATAIFAYGGQACQQYGEGLREYLKTQLPLLGSTGFKGEHGVTFKIVASSAAAYSRMILSKLLICPPRSPTCLLPSVVKRVTMNKALILDDPGCKKGSLEFATISGHHGTTTVKVLSSALIPPQSFSAGRKLLTSEQQNINNPSDCEGYLPWVKQTAVPSDATINNLTPQQILNSMKIPQRELVATAHVMVGRTEVVYTPEEVQTALANRENLDSNQILSWAHPRGGLGGWRHGELATDADAGVPRGASPGAGDWARSADRRRESILRVQLERSAAFRARILSSEFAADDPSTVYEIRCPREGPQPDGSSVAYSSDGTVTTATASGIAIVSDKNGVTIKHAATGRTLATGIQFAPLGTVFREPGGDGYQIKDNTDPAGFGPGGRRRRLLQLEGSPSDQSGEGEAKKTKVVEIYLNALERDLPFKAEVQKVCNKYAKQMQRAGAEQGGVGALPSQSRGEVTPL